MEAKISIVMPVHNAVDYLSQSITAIKDQSFSDWELICIDDGSSDGSREVLLSYAGLDQRIKVLCNDEPRGAGWSRNRGIAESNGNYVMFCDADDWYDPNACAEMLKAIERRKADMVQCYAIIEPEFDNSPPCDIRWFNPPVKWYGLLRRPHRGINSLCWEKIIRRDFIMRNNIRFPETAKHEDEVFCAECAIAARKTSILPKPLYHYRLRGGSLMHTERPDECLIWRHNIKTLKDWAMENGFSERRTVRKYIKKWEAQC